MRAAVMFAALAALGESVGHPPEDADFAAGRGSRQRGR
jgi:hypothetical protein